MVLSFLSSLSCHSLLLVSAFFPTLVSMCGLLSVTFIFLSGLVFFSPVFVVGDFNFDLCDPRDDEERLLSRQLNDWLRAIGAALLPMSRPTRRGKRDLRHPGRGCGPCRLRLEQDLQYPLVRRYL